MVYSSNNLSNETKIVVYNNKGHIISTKWYTHQGTLIQRIKDAILVLQGKAEIIKFAPHHPIL